MVERWRSGAKHISFVIFSQAVIIGRANSPDRTINEIRRRRASEPVLAWQTATRRDRGCGSVLGEHGPPMTRSGEASSDIPTQRTSDNAIINSGLKLATGRDRPVDSGGLFHDRSGRKSRLARWPGDPNVHHGSVVLTELAPPSCLVAETCGESSWGMNIKSRY